MLGMLEGCVSYAGGQSGKTVTETVRRIRKKLDHSIVVTVLQTSVNHSASVGARGGHIEHILSKKVSKKVSQTYIYIRLQNRR